jgi:ABC-2 type transport system permease protein
VLLHRLADTDLAAHLAYQDRIADHHRRLRLFFYPYLFDERPFLAADWDALPRFTPRASSTTAPPASFVALVTIAGIAAAFAASRVRRGGGRSTWLRSLRPAGAVPAE